MCPSPRDPACPFVSKYVLYIQTTYQSGILGQGGWGTGSAKRKKFITLKRSFAIYEKQDISLSLKHHLYKCMYSWIWLLSNRWYRGYRIELSNFVYLASVGVKIEYSVGVQNKVFFYKMLSDGHVCRNIGHNQSQNCENVCFSLSKHNNIHGKLYKIDFVTISVVYVI